MPETTSQEEASKAFRYPLRWRVMDALNAGLDRFWPASMTPYTGLALITPALLLVGLLVLGLFQMADSSLHTLDPGDVPAVGELHPRKLPDRLRERDLRPHHLALGPGRGADRFLHAAFSASLFLHHGPDFEFDRAQGPARRPVPALLHRSGGCVPMAC
jgi:hypothetical protein